MKIQKIKLIKQLGCLLTFFSTLLATPICLAAYKLNLTPGVTSSSRDIYHLHMTILWICCAIGVLVFGFMIYALIKHRKAAGHEAVPFHESTTVEIIWTVIPFIILIAMAFPATKVLITMDDTSKSDLSIKVTGYRWYWHYDYLDEGIGFFSYLTTPDDQVQNRQVKQEHYLLEVDEPMVVPVGKKIKIYTTASDVIHSWWVPALGLKKDAVPGFTNEVWTHIDKPGIYRGQCAELCGAKHGYMPIVVDARSEPDYRAWVEEKKKAQEAKKAAENQVFTKEELIAEGEKIYQSVCAMCHQPNGQGLPPAFPSLVTSQIVGSKDKLKEHIHNVIYGKNAMPAFGAQKSDFEIAAVITYERNSWGHQTGDVVQPKDVKALRDQK
jgi:cytochrome c oxidase subunit 2